MVHTGRFASLDGWIDGWREIGDGGQKRRQWIHFIADRRDAARRDLLHECFGRRQNETLLGREPFENNGEGAIEEIGYEIPKNVLVKKRTKRREHVREVLRHGHPRAAHHVQGRRTASGIGQEGTEAKFEAKCHIYSMASIQTREETGHRTIQDSKQSDCSIEREHLYQELEKDMRGEVEKENQVVIGGN